VSSREVPMHFLLAWVYYGYISLVRPEDASQMAVEMH
jgi:hypothetical protein